MPMTYAETQYEIKKIQEDYRHCINNLGSAAADIPKYSFEDNLEAALIMYQNAHLYLQDVFKLVARSGELASLPENVVKRLSDTFAVRSAGFHSTKALLSKEKPSTIFKLAATAINEDALAAQEMAFGIMVHGEAEYKVYLTGKIERARAITNEESERRAQENLSLLMSQEIDNKKD